MTSGGARWRLVRAGTDAVPAWVRRFFAVRRSPRHRRRRVLLAAAGMVLALVASWAAWGTSLLGVREIRVSGTSILSTTEVSQAAAVPQHTPLLRVETGEVAQRVAALAAVEQVRVSRAWPNALVVAVVERRPVAAVPDGDVYQLVDVEGVPFHTVSQAPLDLPVVVLAAPGPDDPATVAALSVLAALTPLLRADLETLTVAGPASIELSLFSGRTVWWGDATDSENKARVATALLDHEGLPDHDEVVIDVSVPDVVSMR